MRLAVLGLALALPSAALACPGASATAQNATPAAATDLATVDATACAHNTAFVGSACSYTTGMMAQRILSEGADFSFTGRLAEAPNDLESHVAAPFTLAQGAIHLVANEVLDNMPTADRLSLQGKRLNVKGVDYFVVTTFARASAT